MTPPSRSVSYRANKIGEYVPLIERTWQVCVTSSARMWYNEFVIFANDKNITKGEQMNMARERRDYSKEFKLSAVFLMKSKKFKPKEVFAILDVDRQTVYRWLKEYEKYGDVAFNNRAVLPATDVRRIQKENADLVMENEILKKAVAYFAKHNTKK